MKEEWYAEELKRRDKLIDQLKQENVLLMKTAMKQNLENKKLMDKLAEVVN